MKIFTCTLLGWILFLSALVSCKNSDHRVNPADENATPQVRANSVENLNKPYVILVSIDGYRWDYSEKFNPKAIQNIAKRGVRARSLIPVFPSLTFPNHYSIVTGRYASHHGIVSNQFYDPSWGADYRLSDPKSVTDGRWYGGDPLWSAAERAGLLTASYFWVGSEAEINGFRPTYYKEHNSSTSNRDRVKQVIQWLKLPPRERPHLLFLYFSSVDNAGHSYGTESPEVRNAVIDVDKEIEYLMSELDLLNLPVNVLLVSDHGMQNLDESKVVELSRFIDPRIIKKSDSSGAIIKIYEPDTKTRNKIFNALKANENGFKVYLRSQLPERYHYSDSERVGDIVVVGDPGYYVRVRSSKQGKPFRNQATHGWDPNHTPMHGVFYAYGPNIKKRGTIESFENVHIYPLVTHILGIESPIPHDGNIEVLKPIYQN
ncbi:MAG: ectonucleotide pyrophosphatase/phosphodiesterase [Bdellovibrionales bacterium]